MHLNFAGTPKGPLSQSQVRVPYCPKIRSRARSSSSLFPRHLSSWPTTCTMSRRFPHTTPRTVESSAPTAKVLLPPLRRRQRGETTEVLYHNNNNILLMMKHATDNGTVEECTTPHERSPHLHLLLPSQQSVSDQHGAFCLYADRKPLARPALSFERHSPFTRLKPHPLSHPCENTSTASFNPVDACSLESSTGLMRPSLQDERE